MTVKTNRKMANVIPEFKLVGWDLVILQKVGFVEAMQNHMQQLLKFPNFNGRLKQFEELEEIYEKEVELNG